MKLSGLYDDYPRRYGKSKNIVYSKKEFLFNVNRDNKYCDVFVSVYSYFYLKEVKGITKIDSESANINKIFIDMDFKDFIDYKDFYDNNPNLEDLDIKEKEKLLEDYANKHSDSAKKKLFDKVKELEKILDDKDVLRVWVFSGGGFHLYIYIKNKPENKKVFCRNAVVFVSNLVFKEEEVYTNEEGRERTLKLWDPHCPIKLSQMARVIGTYNPRRHLFCISLTKDDIIKGIEWITEKAKKQGVHIYYLGRKSMLFDETLDTSEVLEKCNVIIESGIECYSDNLIELLGSFGILFDEISLCMMYFLKENQNLNYTERYLIITFLYRCGLSETEIKEVLKIILNPIKLFHCCGIIKNGYTPSTLQKSRVESQVPDIISNDYYISCSQIMSYGFCHPLCVTKDVLYYFS